MELTEQQLLKAVEFACNYQKACDYQTVGHHLLENFETVTDADMAITKVLDDLCDTNTNGAKEITIEEIKKYIKGK